MGGDCISQDKYTKFLYLNQFGNIAQNIQFTINCCHKTEQANEDMLHEQKMQENSSEEER